MYNMCIEHTREVCNPRADNFDIISREETWKNLLERDTNTVIEHETVPKCIDRLWLSQICLTYKTQNAQHVKYVKNTRNVKRVPFKRKSWKRLRHLQSLVELHQSGTYALLCTMVCDNCQVGIDYILSFQLRFSGLIISCTVSFCTCLNSTNLCQDAKCVCLCFCARAVQSPMESRS